MSVDALPARARRPVIRIHTTEVVARWAERLEGLHVTLAVATRRAERVSALITTIVLAKRADAFIAIPFIAVRALKTHAPNRQGERIWRIDMKRTHMPVAGVVRVTFGHIVRWIGACFLPRRAIDLGCMAIKRQTLSKITKGN